MADTASEIEALPKGAVVTGLVALGSYGPYAMFRVSPWPMGDVIAGPVAPTVAWSLGAQADDPMAAYLADIFTLPASLAGLPGMSVPAGTGDGDESVAKSEIHARSQPAARRARASAAPRSSPTTRARPPAPRVARARCKDPAATGNTMTSG